MEFFVAVVLKALVFYNVISLVSTTFMYADASSGFIASLSDRNNSIHKKLFSRYHGRIPRDRAGDILDSHFKMNSARINRTLDPRNREVVKPDQHELFKYQKAPPVSPPTKNITKSQNLQTTSTTQVSLVDNSQYKNLLHHKRADMDLPPQKQWLKSKQLLNLYTGSTRSYYSNKQLNMMSIKGSRNYNLRNPTSLRHVVDENMLQKKKMEHRQSDNVTVQSLTQKIKRKVPGAKYGTIKYLEKRKEFDGDKFRPFIDAHKEEDKWRKTEQASLLQATVNMQRVVVLVILATYASCMEMRETVERMVMVRTTGSDLQPAATGFIYKKESDSPASVVEMGESEVMQQLSKMYEQPKSFVAPVPDIAEPFHVTEEESKNVAPSSESKIIPVEEKVYQRSRVDGLADEDIKKVFEYASNYGKYNTNFDDYLKEIGYTDDETVFDGNIHHKSGHEKDRENLNRKKDAKHFTEDDEKQQVSRENEEKYIYEEPHYSHTVKKIEDFTSGSPSQHLKLYEEDAIDDTYKMFINNEDDKFKFPYYVSKHNDFDDNDYHRLVKDHAKSQRYDDGYTAYSDKGDGSSYGYMVRH